MNSTDKKAKLSLIRQELKACRACPLYKNAIQAVPGEGDPEAKIVFVGEAPGRTEDERGVPFCGRSGNLLDRLLNLIYLDRKSVFITNICKHRPPGNRDPLPAEIQACVPFLKRQLLIIKPEIIVTLGRFALNYFVPDAYISRVHGRIRKLDWEGLDLTLMPLYHPAAGLRNGTVLKDLKADFVRLGLHLGLVRRKHSDSGSLSRPKVPKRDQVKLL